MRFLLLDITCNAGTCILFSSSLEKNVNIMNLTKTPDLSKLYPGQGVYVLGGRLA